MSQQCQPGRESLHKALQTQYQKMQEMVEGVRRYDDMAIHDMRVASRRMRMALEIYRPYVRKSARKTMKQELRLIGRALGRRRELDVMVAMLKEHREESRGLWQRFMDHAITLLEGRCASEQGACLDATAHFDGAPFQHAYDTLISTIDTSSGCVVALAQEKLMDALEAVRNARRVWKRHGDAEELHEVRIAIKRFRYACEFYKPLFGLPMETYLKRLKEVQAGLGEWNECRLLEEMLLILGNAADFELAQGAPLVAEAYGSRAEVLEETIGVQVKALFCKEGRRAFELLVTTNSVPCGCAHQ